MHTPVFCATVQCSTTATAWRALGHEWGDSSMPSSSRRAWVWGWGVGLQVHESGAQVGTVRAAMTQMVVCPAPAAGPGHGRGVEFKVVISTWAGGAATQAMSRNNTSGGMPSSRAQGLHPMHPGSPQRAADHYGCCQGSPKGNDGRDVYWTVWRIGRQFFLALLLLLQQSLLPPLHPTQHPAATPHLRLRCLSPSVAAHQRRQQTRPGGGQRLPGAVMPRGLVQDVCRRVHGCEEGTGVVWVELRGCRLEE